MEKVNRYFCLETEVTKSSRPAAIDFMGKVIFPVSFYRLKIEPVLQNETK